MRGVTPQQESLLGYLRSRADSPSYSEMRDDLGMSKSVIHALMTQLSDRGLITFIPNRARSVRVVDDAPARDRQGLGAYPTSALIAEVQRRGFKVRGQ